MQGPGEPNNSPVLRDSLNRPCLDVEAAAKPRVVNPDMLDHIVSVKNNCLQMIKVKVCYFNSQNCNSFDLPAQKRVDTLLGSMNRISTFRYTVYQRR